MKDGLNDFSGNQWSRGDFFLRESFKKMEI